MPEGFFPQSTWASDPPQSSIPQCGVCKLYNNCESPKMPVAGQGEKQILIIGEAPGETEDQKGEAFVGKTGSFLDF